MIFKRQKFRMIILLLIIGIVGSFYMHSMYKQNLKLIKDEALKLAVTASVSFQTEEIKKLEVQPQDIQKEAYIQIKNSLMELVNINQDARFAYMYTERNGKIYFMADSETVEAKDYSPPGQEYSEADEYCYLAIQSDEPIISQPSFDRWGNWTSILVPMKDYKKGETVAVFGLDYPTGQWKLEAVKNSIPAGIAALCLMSLLLTIVSILNKNKALKEDKKKLAELNVRLSEKEQVFRTIFEQSPLGITYGNYCNNISNTNSKFEEIIGRTKDELKDKTWMNITHPDDIQEDMDNFEKFKTGEIESYTMKKRYIRPDNSVVWVNMTIAPLMVGDENDQTHICIVEDITERVKAEQNLQESERSNAMLLSNLPGMAYRCNFDKNWTMQFVSEGCYELTGYRPESLIFNKETTFNDLITPDYRDYLWDKWNKILKEKKVFREEYPIMTAYGTIKWVFEQGQGVYDENDQVKVIEGLIIDISDRKMREDEIRYLNYHDVLTGLYNRRYLEEAKIQLNNDNMYPLSVIIGDINGLKLINDALGHDEGDKLIVSIAEILMSCCRTDDIIARTGGDEFSILLPKTKKEEANKIIRQIGNICEKYKPRIMNEAYHVSISLGCATKISREEPFNSIIKEAEDNMYRNKLLQSKSLHSSIISSMKSTLYAKSQETEEHANRLISLSKAIGLSLDLTDVQLNELELLSTLHDIGKIGISDTILNKPAKLNEDEWVEMRKHPEIGYRIAMSSPELVSIADYILSHHERWDGTGYPQGLKGEDIPLLSRIIAVADAYDAMTADRPYRSAISKMDAIEEIKKNAGTQFDPKIAELFLNILA